MALFKRQPNIVTDEKRVTEVLTRGVDGVLPQQEELKKLLMSGKRIRLYQGFDPTSPDLHIGHMVGLRKLRDFQRLGHQVIFLMGDGTGQAGDPSGKTKSRDTFFTREQLRENAKEYKKQAGRILDFKGDNPIEIKWNSTWLNKLRLVDILNIAHHFTLQQLSERDMFQERMKKGEPVNLREFLYPLLQGYDSVAMEVDLEIGGSDQMFNMMVGRTLSKNIISKDKFVLTTPLLTDSQGTKIGKTEGNAIGLTDNPKDLYGKIMSLSDDVIVKGFEYLTDVSMEEIKTIEQGVQNENPKTYKKRLAFEIVAQLNTPEEAEKAQKAFEDTFEKGNTPKDIQILTSASDAALIDVLVKEGIVSSKSDFRRLIEQGAIKNLATGDAITDQNEVVTSDVTLKIGKKRFVKIETQ